MELEEKYYPVNSIRLHAMEAGDRNGEVLLFLHGFPEFWWGWRNQIEYFAGKGYRVVVPDQRGYNLSDKPADKRAYRLQHCTNDIAALAKQLGSDRIYLVGHDWGGAVAWSLAIHYPELLKKLIVLNLPHPQVMKQSPLYLPKQILKSWYIGFFQLPGLPETILSFNHFQLLKKSMQTSSHPGTFSEGDMRQYKKAWQQPGAFTAMINWYRAIRYSNPGLDKEVQVPTLLIWGKQDRALSHEMAQPSIDKCANGRLEMIDDATHWLQHEKAARVNLLIEEFIREAKA